MNSISKKDILATIIDTKKKEVEKLYQQADLKKWQSLAYQQPNTRDFVQAIETKVNLHLPAVIAEIKKASPSQGVIRENFDVAAIAVNYEKHGATCLSVLTDVEYFQGDDDYIFQAKLATNLPILRKEFIIDQVQIYQSRVIGADAILLIVSALNISQLLQFSAIAKELGLAVLVECHDQDELNLALQLSTTLIGINNRNLRTFSVDLNTSIQLKENLPQGRIIISESGIKNKSDLQQLQNAGIYSYLIGETFMRSHNPGEELAKLVF